MKDKVTIERVAQLHPKIRDKFAAGIDSAETKLGQYIAVRVVQGFRTFAEQGALYALGRTLKGSNAKPGHPMGDIVTKAKAGQGFHNYGLAIDFAILYDKDKNGTFESLSWDEVADLDRDGESDWREVVDVFKALGFEWGGDWKSIKDDPHIQFTFGYTWQQLLAKWEKNDFIRGTQYLNI